MAAAAGPMLVGLADVARHVTGCHLTQERKVQGAWHDVAGIICQALHRGDARGTPSAGEPHGGGPAQCGGDRGQGRGLHSFTSQLNLRDVHAIGGARRGCVARAKGVLRGV